MGRVECVALGDLRIHGDTLVTLILTMDRVREHVFYKKISQAWQEAGRELRIRVTAPFNLRIGGDDVTAEAFIRDFGGPDGAIAVASETSCFRPGLMRLGILSLIYSKATVSIPGSISSRRLMIGDGLGLLEKNRSGIPVSRGPNRARQSGIHPQGLKPASFKLAFRHD